MQKPGYNIGDVDHGNCRLLRELVSTALSPNRDVGKEVPHMAVFVISKHGERLMPTTRYGRVRHLLRSGKAVIHSRKPFTIQLTYDAEAYVQPIEVCQDTGYQYIGMSVKSPTKEYVSAEYSLLRDEKERHDDQRRYRRTRRNRKRYRAPRFNNRRASKKAGWFAPSIKNKANRHVDLIERITAVAPITSITIEVGKFDSQLLKAVTEGKPIPKGIDYQRGERYGIETLRAAVFQRDVHKCRFCGRGLKEDAFLHIHHVYFWRGQHGNSLDELAACCEKCHTPANHKKGGKLWGYDKKFPRYTGAAFMSIVRWYIWNRLKTELSDIEFHITYGAATKLARKEYGIEKSHAGDAYAMGQFHPQERVATEYYQKLRRNNRILEKFYDAKYIDLRDGKKKSGAQLGCQRLKRKEPRMSDKNLRIYHGKKVSKGHRSIRRQRYAIRPGDRLLFNCQGFVSNGCHSNGTRVILNNKKSVPIKKVQVLGRLNGWESITKGEAG